MILTAIVAFAVLGAAYMWGARGFFSALIHMVCTIVAGAIAFAVWEPLTAVFMTMFNGGMIDWAHGLALGLPFAVSLLALRLATNAVLPKNVDLDGVTNMVGGGVCGAVSGVIAAGIFVISLGYLRFENTLMGYEPVTYASNGSLVQSSQLILPADRLTAAFYGKLSATTLRTDDNLGRWHPQLADEGPLLRMNCEDGKSRHVTKPGSFEVIGHYTVESSSGGLFNDSIEPQKKRSYTYLDNQPAADAQTTLHGYTLRFKPSANEKSGTVVVGNAQVQLIAEREDGSTVGVQPAAVFSEARPPANPKKEEASQHLRGRWAFEAPKTFISTVGGRNESPMSFEFPVPKGSTPIGLYVKGVRYELAGLPEGAKYSSPQQREQALLGAGGAGATVRIDAASAFKTKGLLVAPNLGTGSNVPFNIVFQKDDLRGLSIDDTKKLTDGDGKFLEKEIQGRNSEPALQVRALACPEDQVIVQVVLDGRNKDWGLLSPIGAGAELDKAPILADDQGTPYSAFGYVYKGNGEVWVSLHPDAPIGRLNDPGMPIMSRSKPNDQFVLLFRVGKNQKIKYFAVGDKALLEMAPPFETTR